MHHNKLVRDNIPEHIRKNGGAPVTHIADDAEYWEKLKEKLTEEVQEFLHDENAEEVADILEVLDAIVAYKQFDPKHVATLKTTKAAERGHFEKRIILEES
jgi:predicted house-cleaning noncanonical NTP pyrophosphatase (MazG superfamily)